MIKLLYGFWIYASILAASEIPLPMGKWKTNIERLSEFEKYVLLDKGTERAFTGEYVTTKEKGVYRCKVCDMPLYRSDDKFDSHCGWPSFDDALPGAIKEIADKDGIRREIVCANCGAHMGHLFRGEGYTKKNSRHCVNSVSLKLDKKTALKSTEAKAYFAGGCFWGSGVLHGDDSRCQGCHLRLYGRKSDKSKI